jgi:hypothetical protein
VHICTRDIKSSVAMAKSAFKLEEDSFHQKISLKCKEESSEVQNLERSIFLVLGKIRLRTLCTEIEPEASRHSATSAERFR